MLTPQPFCIYMSFAAKSRVEKCIKFSPLRINLSVWTRRPHFQSPPSVNPRLFSDCLAFLSFIFPCATYYYNRQCRLDHAFNLKCSHLQWPNTQTYDGNLLPLQISLSLSSLSSIHQRLNTDFWHCSCSDKHLFHCSHRLAQLRAELTPPVAPVAQLSAFYHRDWKTTVCVQLICVQLIFFKWSKLWCISCVFPFNC